MLTAQLTARRQPTDSGEHTARQRLAALRVAADAAPVAVGPPQPDPRRSRREPSESRWSDPAPARPVAPEARPIETTAPLPVVGPVAAGRAARLLARWVPASWQGARLDPGRRGAVALVAVAAAAALVAAVGVWRDRPVAEPPLPLAGAVSAGDPGRAADVSAASVGAPGPRPAGGVQLVISVAGKVRRPGLVRVRDGARVADAIAAAGGPLPRVDLTSLNLARRVADGEQLLVGVVPPPGAEPAGGAAGPAGGAPGQAGGASAPGGKIDLNRATVEQLDTLPGVGPVTAARILDWRTHHGRFTAVEQLREVEGIGERRFGQLRSLVTV